MLDFSDGTNGTTPVDQDPQGGPQGPQQPKPGDDLDRLFAQYGGPQSVRQSTQVATHVVGGGDALDSLYARYGAPPASPTTPPVRSGPSVTTLAGALPSLRPIGAPSRADDTATTEPPPVAANRPSLAYRAIQGALTAADATRVGQSPSAGITPSLLDRVVTFPLQVAFGAVQHPIDFVSAPVKAAITLNRAAAEQDAENAIAMNGGPIGAVPRTVSPREAGIAGAQVSALLAGPELSELGEAAGTGIGKLLGGSAETIAPTAGHVVGHLAAAGSAGAAFDPNDPLVGFFGSMLMGLPHPAIVDAASRAVNAGRTGVASMLDAARQADDLARTQGRADAQATFNRAVAQLVPTLSPQDIAFLRMDPVLGPLSRDALARAGVAERPVPDLSGADQSLRQTPQTEPDQSLDDALGRKPATSPTPTVAPAARATSAPPSTAGDALDRLAEQWGVSGTSNAPSVSDVSTERSPDNGTVVPVTATSIADAQSGRPFRATLMRGQGRADSPYNELGAQVPILGQGRYTTNDETFAQHFGPNVTTHDVALRNPLVIDSDGQWRALTSRAGWKYPNPFGQDAATVASDIGRLRSQFETLGYDGIVIRIPAGERNGQLLGKVFGADQVIEFNPQPAPSVTPAVTPAATEGLSPSVHPPAPSVPLPDIPSSAGKPTRVLLRDGQALPAEYRVVSADDLQSSHDPFSFNPNSNYPEGVQGRDYQRNTSAQQAVAQRALQFNPDIALNPSESVSESTPTILPNGVVIAGNERSMLPRRAIVQAPDRYAAYVDQLKQRAAQFGIDPASIDATRNPVLVRTLADPADVNGGPQRWAAINRLSDEVSTKAKSATEEGAARSAKLAQATDALDHLTDTLRPEQTINEYLGTPDGRTFVRKLMSDGVVTPDEFSRLASPDGSLTDDGRLAVRRMLLSTAVTDPTAILDAPASIVGKIEHAVPSIVSTKGTTFDISALTTAALKLAAEARDNGLTIRDLAAQGSLFGERRVATNVAALASFLDESKPSAVKSAFRRYATLAQEALGNAESTDMFGGTGFDTPHAAFREAFPATDAATPGAFNEHDAAAASHQSSPQDRLFSLAPSDASSGDPLDRMHAAYGRPTERRPAPTKAGDMLADARNASLASDGGGVDTVRNRGAGKALGSPTEPETPDIAVRDVNRFTDSLRKIFAPASRGEEARLTGLTAREHEAVLVHSFEQAKYALKTFARTMDSLSVAEQLDFIDRMEHGQLQATPELTRAAGTIRKLLDDARDAIRALGNGQLESWIENYFPHIWADPERAQGIIASIMGKRSLTGTGSFLKRRAIPTVREGIEAGLVPVSYNPIDLSLLKLREMHRYLAGQRILQEMKGDGRLKFVDSFSKAPEGMAQIDDKISTVYGPPKVEVTEAFDYHVRAQLEQVMADLGIKHERRPNIGGQMLGYAEGASHITTRSATDLSVLEHELGHSLDARLDLWRRLHEFAGDPTSRAAIEYRKTIDRELRSLADLRFEGAADSVTPNYKSYVREKPEKIANAVMGMIYAKERMQQVAPNVLGRLREILRENPTTAKLLAIKPSFRLGTSTFDVKTPGQVVLGHWYAPEPVARVVNNYLSPGLTHSAIGPFFDVYRGAGNLLNIAQLGLSAFHLTMTALESAVSKVSVGVQKIGSGQFGEAARDFASAPLAPALALRGGAELRHAYRAGTTDPELAQHLDALDAAGGRVGMDQQYGGTAWRKFQLAMHDATTNGLSGTQRLGKAGEAAARAVPAIIEKVASPIMEHWVPLLKAGAFRDIAQFELSKLPPGYTRAQFRTVMARAFDSVENRFGQLTYSNLFWNGVTKDLLMSSARSVGWDAGTYREIGGGVSDLGHAIAHPSEAEITPRMAHLVALPLTIGLVGGILNYLYTGQVPHGKDWYYPRTGRVNPDGSDERVQPPSYMRDMRDYLTSPVQTLANKANPFPVLLGELLSNKQFGGVQVRNPMDPIGTQAGQVAQFIGSQFEPLGVHNMRDQLARGQSVGQAAQSFLGITPAPRDVVRTPAEQQMRSYSNSGVPDTRTPEEAEKSQLMHSLEGKVRMGDTTATGAIRAAVEREQLSTRAALSALRAGRMSGSASAFQHLPLDQELDVFSMASPTERTQWGPVLQRRLMTIRPGEYTPQQMAAIRARYAGIIAGAHP